MKRALLVLWLPVLACCCAAPRTATTPFDRMDRNGDGRLTRSEFRGRPPAFDNMDRNRDGSLTRQEAAGTPLVGGTGPAGRTEAARPSKTPVALEYIDTHNHLVNRRIRGEFNFERPARIALEAMDAAGVKKNLLLPMPQAPGQKLRLRFEDLQPIVRKYPDRFVLGSDEIVKPAGDHPSAGSIASTVGLLTQLPPDLRSRIGCENAYRLYGLSK